MAKNPEESNPLLGTDENNDNELKPINSKNDDESKSQPPSLPPKQPPVPTVAQPQVAETYGWAADGLPMMGQPMMGRQPWSSGLSSCLGRNDDFCSSDLEVFLEVWLHVSSTEAMLKDLGQPVEASHITACLMLGSCEALTRHCGCCGSFVEDDIQREQCETACDFATHILCHPCSLCQEGREIRRRLPHPGFNAQPVLVMIPPGGQ
ncbi:Cell number regulator 8, partial [Bienertia sinuspersici]